MPSRLTAEHARQSVTAHAAAKGLEIHSRYPRLGWADLKRLLGDSDFVRYPCDLVFETAALLPGEFAHAEPKGSRPEDGFRMVVHPFFETTLDRVPLLVLYQLVSVNYGGFASAEDAEIFGAAALGLDREDYYATVCAMADELEAALPRNDDGLERSIVAAAAIPGDSPTPCRKGTEHSEPT